jgi:hypothetical protein
MTLTAAAMIAAYLLGVLTPWLFARLVGRRTFKIPPGIQRGHSDLPEARVQSPLRRTIDTRFDRRPGSRE